MKKFFLLLILFLIICIFLLFYRIGPLLGNSVFMPSYNNINKFYMKNNSPLNGIVTYMKSHGSNHLRWDSINKDVISTSYSERIYIPDNIKLYQDIQQLYDNDMQHILKENNYITFVLWSSMDSSCGIIYSEDNNIVIEDVELKNINNEWYYFIHHSDR